MTSARRRFLRKLGLLGGQLAFGGLLTSARGEALRHELLRIENLSPKESARDELFWHQIKMAYSVSSSLINLNNGGVSPQPLVVQNAVDRYNKLGNESPTFYHWRVLKHGKASVRRKLAKLAGCDPEEIAINRNASEALETVIFGLRLQAGDEVVLCTADYPNMMNAWKQREHRDGIKLRWVEFDFPIDDSQTIIDKYVAAFTDKTKILHLTHINNWNGQRFPAKALIKEAHRRGIEVVLDAAHSFALLDMSLHDLDCDYMGTSLHKWLCAPFGTGMLYVRRDKIKPLYPMFAAPDPEEDKISKFEHLGTLSISNEQAIGQAIDFHQMIGTRRKFERLQYLRQYWINAIKDIPGIQLHSPMSPELCGAIGLFSIEGKEPSQIMGQLRTKYYVHVVAINTDKISGIRVTPNVYTLTSDLDVFIEGIKTLATT